MHPFVETGEEKEEQTYVSLAALDKRLQCGHVNLLSNLKCALSVQAHLGHGYQHLLIDELNLSLRFHLLTLCYQLEENTDTVRKQRQIKKSDDLLSGEEKKTDQS